MFLFFLSGEARSFRCFRDTERRIQNCHDIGRWDDICVIITFLLNNDYNLSYFSMHAIPLKSGI